MLTHNTASHYQRYRISDWTTFKPQDDDLNFHIGRIRAPSMTATIPLQLFNCNFYRISRLMRTFENICINAKHLSPRCTDWPCPYRLDPSMQVAKERLTMYVAINLGKSKTSSTIQKSHSVLVYSRTTYQTSKDRWNYCAPSPKRIRVRA